MESVAASLHEHRAPPALENVAVEEPRDCELLLEYVAGGICQGDLQVAIAAVPIPYI